MSVSIDDLCRGLPEEFQRYLKYCRGLGFDEKPDYAYLRHLLKKVFAEQGYEHDLVFDWVVRDKVLDELYRKQQNQRCHHGSPSLWLSAFLGVAASPSGILYPLTSWCQNHWPTKLLERVKELKLAMLPCVTHEVS